MSRAAPVVPGGLAASPQERRSTKTDRKRAEATSSSMRAEAAAAPMMRGITTLFASTVRLPGRWAHDVRLTLRDGAIAALRSLVALNENHDAARAQLATLLEAGGGDDEALAVLESSVFIYPFDPKLHERRAALATRLKQPIVARDARRAILALDPVDKAEAYYQLALAEMDAGDRGAARRSVVRSLEIAPRFERAQDLLLKIHRGEGVQ